MDAAMGILFFLSILALIVFIILLVVKLIFKKGMNKKKIFLFMASSVVLMFLSLILAPDLTPEQKSQLAEKKAEKTLAKQEKEANEENNKKKEIEEKKEDEKDDKGEKTQKGSEEKEETENTSTQDKKENDKESTNKKKKEEESVSIDKQLEKENSDIEKAKLDNGELTMEFDGDGSWSENSLVTHNAIKTLELMNKAFDDNDVSSVTGIVTGTLTDEKGNDHKEDIVSIHYSRDTFEELNYKNFHSLAMGEEWRIYNQSDTYQIHAAIFKGMKDKVKSNLEYGLKKFE